MAVIPIAEADQRSVLVDGIADVSFVRLPIDRDGLSVIRLYSEVAVVVAPRDHPIAAFDAVSLADLTAETLRLEPAAEAIDLVVAGVGIVILPQSIARQHARKDLVARPITDAPETEVAVAWLADGTTEDIEEFVGIVRGRTAGSSRGPVREPAVAPASKPVSSKAVKPSKTEKPSKPGTRHPGSRPKPPTRGKKPRGRR